MASLRAAVCTSAICNAELVAPILAMIASRRRPGSTSRASSIRLPAIARLDRLAVRVKNEPAFNRIPRQREDYRRSLPALRRGQRLQPRE